MNLRKRVENLETGGRGKINFGPLFRAFNAVAALEGKPEPFALTGEPIWGQISDYYAMLRRAEELNEAHGKAG